MNDHPVFEALQQLQANFDGEIRVDEVSRKLYSTDASAYQETPVAVALPSSKADIRKLILLAGKHGIGLIPRTAGTSLSGSGCRCGDRG